MNDMIIPPIIDRQTLPSMWTLYRRDRAALSTDEVDARIYHSIDIPARVAYLMCVHHPKLWPHVMDFTQEGNLMLLQAHAKCDPGWDLMGICSTYKKRRAGRY